MATPEILAGLGVALKENAPGVVLPAHKRYALSMIADGQSARATADGFTKAASNGVSPEAHAADNAAEQMAAKIGIAPPPMPAPVPQEAGGAASAGQQAFSASNPDPASGYTAAPVAGQTAASPAAGPVALNTGPPPGTYYDPVRKISVYDPNYHGPYQPIIGGTDVSGGVGSPPSGPSSPAPGSPAVMGQGAGIPDQPVHKYAEPDQARIDHAWQMFDLAMARIPTPPAPADMPKIGMEQLFILAAAGAIDPMAAPIVAKGILEAPVQAKLLTDQEREKAYGHSIGLWQNETQRTMQTATNVERSEVSQANARQRSFDQEYNTDVAARNKALGQQGAGLRRVEQDLSRQITKIQDILTSKPLDPATRKQYTDQLNDLVAQHRSLRDDILGTESGQPSLFFDAGGKPTPQWEDLQKKIALNEEKMQTEDAKQRTLGAKFDLTEGQLDRLYTLLPYEAERMDSQTAMNYGRRLQSVYSALNMASQVDKRTFDEGLAIGRFNLDTTKAQLSEINSLLKDKVKERDALNKKADKAEADAAKIRSDYRPKPGSPKDIEATGYEDEAKKLRQAAQDMEGATGSLGTLQAAHDRIAALLGNAGASLPGVPEKPTPESIGAMSRPSDRSLPASIRNNNPGAMWPGPASRALGATGSQDIAGGNKIATFPDPISGAAAQFYLLATDYRGMSLRSLIHKWSGGNSPEAYVASITKSTGLKPDQKIDINLLASAEGLALVKAMARHEAGREFPLTDAQWQEAQAKVFTQTQSAPARKSYTKPKSTGQGATNELGGPMRPG